MGGRAEKHGRVRTALAPPAAWPRRAEGARLIHKSELGTETGGLPPLTDARQSERGSRHVSALVREDQDQHRTSRS
jgi:hypothetical protein